MFINRRTGRITVAQQPNIPLAAFIVLSATLYVFRPSGRTEAVVRVLAAVALVLWSSDELVRGVNPFRRILGLVVLVVTSSSLFLKIH
jgi:hypothetical protein